MSENAVEAKLIDRIAKRPPLVQLRLDVRLHNREREPRWFVLPAALPADQGGVDGVESIEAGGVVVGRFQGTGRFQALLLAPGADITIHHLSVDSWGETEPRSIELIVASAITIGGEPAQAWFGADPTTPAHAEVDLRNARAAGSRHTDDRHEEPCELAVLSRVQVALK